VSGIVARMATGYIDVTGGRVWYETMGTGDQPPLLLLHGGPGATHQYLRPFAERIAELRPVVVYDQLGCGNSDQPDDPSLWTVDRFVAELDQVRAALGLDRCHMLGQSWGGWLAIEYFCRGTTGVAGLVLASTSASIPQFVAEAARLIDAMPEPARSTLIELGARGAYDDPAYGPAVMEFYKRHLYRNGPWPDAMLRTSEALETNQVYHTLNGPTEFDVTGPLRTWDRSADLGRIDVPTLITCGRYDEITPACAETIRAGVAGAELVIFEHSAHIAHLEELELYTATVDGFLRRVERD
jgi:proline-specific peptidase